MNMVLEIERIIAKIRKGGPNMPGMRETRVLLLQIYKRYNAGEKAKMLEAMQSCLDDPKQTVKVADEDVSVEDFIQGYIDPLKIEAGQ